MGIYTSEIASTELVSDNPVHQRLLFPYKKAKEYVKGSLLEIGCGEGRGIEVLRNVIEQYSGIDKNKMIIDTLTNKYPEGKFYSGHIPPIPLEDESFDSIFSSHVIEHIKNHKLYIKEVHRLLKPGGVAVIVTPNIKLSLTRNPWHIREYTSQQLHDLFKAHFNQVESFGIHGNEKVMEYHEMNRKSVAKITKLDILNLQYRLPGFMLRIPYDILNRMNRNKLSQQDNELSKSISVEDYFLSEDSENGLDHFVVVRK